MHGSNDGGGLDPIVVEMRDPWLAEWWRVPDDVQHGDKVGGVR